MKSHARALLILILLLAPMAANARTLDRSTVVRAAANQNPQVAAARAEEAAVTAQIRQADASRWPMLSLTTGVGPSLKATLLGNTVRSAERQYRDLALSDLRPLFLGNVTLVQPIYTFGKISLRREAAEQGLRARQAQTRMERADVAFDAARIYEGYLLARDAERFFGETLHWLDSTLQSTRDKLARNLANVTERDVLRLQTSLALASMGLNQAQAGKAQARAGLCAYLGLPPDEEITVAEDELTPVGAALPSMAALIELANRKRPELAALRAGDSALSALARAEGAGLYPDLFVLAFLDTAFTPGRDWIQTRFVVDPLNHVVPGALVGLRWQLQGKMATARADEQASRASALRHLRQWADAGIPAEVRRAYEDVMRARKDIDEGSRATAKAKQWMVQASADHAVGLLDLGEVSDAVEAYVTLRMALLQARFAHNVGMAALSKATGTLDGSSDLFYLAPASGPTRE